MNVDAVNLADALRAETVRTAAGATTVRRADWRTTAVAVVGSDGTVTTTDNVIARRAATYERPRVGDRIRITQSGSGNWVAEGRLAPAAGDDWVTPSLTSPWANFGAGYQPVRYRLYANGDVALEGVVGTGATSVSGTSAVFTLPDDRYWPQATQMVDQVMNGNGARQLTINNLGQVRFVNLPAGAVAFITINARFSTL